MFKFSNFTAFILSGVLLVLVGVVLSAKYKIRFQNPDIFTPCEDAPDKFITNYVDLSKLSFEFLEDDNVRVSGSIELIKLIPDSGIFDIQILRKKGSEWANTMYNMKRANFCASFYDSNEIWYKYTKRIPVDERKCPPRVGLTVDIDEIADVVIALPGQNIEGDYKVVVNVQFPSAPEESMCGNIYVHGEKL